MELLTPLQKVTKERLLSEEEVIKLGKDICKALILCESRNIIHRDIKPDNIMISQFGDYKLGDFGVSKVMSHTTGATMTGTEGYMAPEVLHIEKYGKEVDIYSLGIVMYWLLNNRRMPFIGADEKVTLVNVNQAAIRRYQGEKIPAPKNGSDELKKIVLKACEYKPKDRYLTAQEMYDALEEIGSGKSYTKNTVSGYQAEPSSGDEWMESGKTVGKTEGGFSGGQTARNSWGGGGTIGRTIGRTIGKLKGNTEKKQKEVQEEPKTIGVKKAYQKQEKKAEEKKEVTAENKPKKVTKTKFGYIWSVLVIGFSCFLIYELWNKEGLAGFVLDIFTAGNSNYTVNTVIYNTLITIIIVTIPFTIVLSKISFLLFDAKKDALQRDEELDGIAACLIGIRLTVAVLNIIGDVNTFVQLNIFVLIIVFLLSSKFCSICYVVGKEWINDRCYDYE